MLQWLITANVVPSSPILFSSMMEALSSSETSALTRTTRRNIPEDGIPDVILTVILSLLYHFELNLDLHIKTQMLPRGRQLFQL
jgi:hypothetical protein